MIDETLTRSIKEIPEGGVQIKVTACVGVVSRERVFTARRMLSNDEISAILRALEWEDDQVEKSSPQRIIHLPSES